MENTSYELIMRKFHMYIRKKMRIIGLFLIVYMNMVIISLSFIFMRMILNRLILENGVLLKKKDVSGAPWSTLGDLYIGLDENGDEYLKWNMDDLRIYSRALSAEEVVTLYDSGLKESPELLTQKNAMVAHYKFDGDNEDSSKFGNDAELVAGKITYVEGKKGKASQFKKGTYLEVPDNISLDYGYVPFGYQNNSFGYYYYMENSINNKWAHLGVTFNTEEIRFYHNGKMVKKEKIADYNGIDMAHGLGDLMIGSDGEYFFEGTMDELKIYNYPLSANEVKEDYEAVDTLSICKDNQSNIKSMKKGATVALAPSRKYFETGETTKLTQGVTFMTQR